MATRHTGFPSPAPTFLCPVAYGIHTAAQLDRLRALIDEIRGTNRFQSARLGRVAKIDQETFVGLPLLTKQELVADQAAHPPFGSNLTYPLERYSRYHQSSGTTGEPLRVLDTPETWDWWGRCWLEVLRVAGVTPRDRAFFAFSFAPFIGFWSAYHGVSMLGAMTISGGGADSVRRLRLIEETGPTVLLSTPTYALHLAEVAEREGVDLASSTITTTIHAGEPGAGIPATRRRIEQAWGAKVFDHAGASEIGAFGVGDEDGVGLYVNEDEFIAEVIDPATLFSVEAGGEGELVITNLGRGAWPVIRYRTGDWVRPTRVESGEMQGRLLLEGGILGRVDDMVTVRGVNVYPSAIEEVVRSIEGAGEFRIVASTFAEMDELGIEVEGDGAVGEAVARRIREKIGIRVDVKSVEGETLPRWEAKARRFEDRRKK